MLPAGTREAPRAEGRADEFVSVAAAKDELEEALGLVEAMGDGWRVVGSEMLSVTGTVCGRSNHLFGTGQMARVAEKVRWMKRHDGQGGLLNEAEGEAGERRRRRRRAVPERPAAVFVNVDQLRPDQQRAMQASWGCPVLDRFLVVLQIFKARATTREAMLRLEMVEVDLALAHLVDPDALRGEEHAKLDQQRGGGGGATRGGPGEKVIEVRRSQLRQRHATLRKRLAAASERAAELRRQERERRTLPVVALVGYTNAGKSELQARLVGAAGGRAEPRRAHDALFASLDTHARRGRLPDGTEALFIDTVGFVRRLSHRLVGCFRDTLRAARDADVLVHVVDFASPHAAAQRASVLQTLHELAVPPETLDGLVTAHNKCDKLDAPERRRWEAAQDADVTPRGAVMCSALLGDGCDELAALIARRLRAKQGRSKRELRLDVDGPDGHHRTGAGGVLEQQLAYLHRHPRVAVLEQRTSRCGAQLVVTAEIDEETFLRFRGRRWHADPSSTAASAA